MKWTKFTFALLLMSMVGLVVVFQDCSGGFKAFTSSTSTSAQSLVPTVPGSNELPVCVGACGFTVSGKASNSTNEVYLTVQVCVSGTSTCQTIPNIRLDTNSSGLRIFSAALNGLKLAQAKTAAGDSLAECYAGSAFGPVMTADVLLGGEAPVTIPIQVIDSTYGGGNGGNGCTQQNMLTQPSDISANGALGIAFLQTDCSQSACSSGSYYIACPNDACGAAAAIEIPIDQQVANPVAALTTDNNGFLLQFPTTASAPSLQGSLILGIGTESNNQPGNVTLVPATTAGTVSVALNGGSTSEWIVDVGYNSVQFSAPNSIPGCTDLIGGALCPSNDVSVEATVGSMPFSFQVGDADKIHADTTDFVIPDFAWRDLSVSYLGLPFFIGRTVYFGLDGKSSLLGTGPYIGIQ